MNARLLLSTIAVGTLLAPAIAQVPNGGFENWATPTGATYEDPVGWITLNALTSAFPGMGLSCEKGTPGAVGNYYATVTTRTATGIGTIQGILSLGDPVTGRTGFAYTTRPASFTGQWQYNVQATDSGMVAMVLSKWNTATNARDVVGGAVVVALGNLAGWHAINQPFVYQSAATPDSAFVMVASSLNHPVAGSFIKVDALAASGIATGIAEEETSGLQVFPSPASDWISVGGEAPMKSIIILDITGRPVANRVVNTSTVKLDVSGLAHGKYLVHVEMQDGKRMVRSFVKE